MAASAMPLLLGLAIVIPWSLSMTLRGDAHESTKELDDEQDNTREQTGALHDTRTYTMYMGDHWRPHWIPRPGPSHRFTPPWMYGIHHDPYWNHRRPEIRPSTSTHVQHEAVNTDECPSEEEYTIVSEKKEYLLDTARGSDIDISEDDEENDKEEENIKEGRLMDTGEASREEKDMLQIRLSHAQKRGAAEDVINTRGSDIDMSEANGHDSEEIESDMRYIQVEDIMGERGSDIDIADISAEDHEEETEKRTCYDADLNGYLEKRVLITKDGKRVLVRGSDIDVSDTSVENGEEEDSESQKRELTHVHVLNQKIFMKRGSDLGIGDKDKAKTSDDSDMDGDEITVAMDEANKERDLSSSKLQAERKLNGSGGNEVEEHEEEVEPRKHFQGEFVLGSQGGRHARPKVQWDANVNKGCDGTHIQGQWRAHGSGRNPAHPEAHGDWDMYLQLNRPGQVKAAGIWNAQASVVPHPNNKNAQADNKNGGKKNKGKNGGHKPGAGGKKEDGTGKQVEGGKNGTANADDKDDEEEQVQSYDLWNWKWNWWTAPETNSTENANKDDKNANKDDKKEENKNNKDENENNKETKDGNKKANGNNKEDKESNKEVNENNKDENSKKDNDKDENNKQGKGKNKQENENNKQVNENNKKENENKKEAENKKDAENKKKKS